MTMRLILMAAILLFGLSAKAQSPLDLNSLDQQARQLPRLHSLLISQNGELILERYYHGRTANQPANLKSASKSILSALIGIAIDKGYISSVDQPLSDFFPEYLGTELEDVVADITVENLLTMQAGLASTSGRNYGRWVVRQDWVEGALAMPMVAEPGTDMIYSTGSTHLLSAILERASGMNSKAFAQRYLADPLGFRMAYWSQDPKGIYFGGNDMEMRPRDMLAIGELFINGGQYNGEQLISRSWVADSMMARAESPRGEGRYYGYGWWLRDMAGLQVPLAWGYGGQLMFILPEFDMVVVATSDSTPGGARRNHLRRLYDLVEYQIIAPLLDEHLKQ
jgi:CubicO group peptidase (beta-lactamase class C family)